MSREKILTRIRANLHRKSTSLSSEWQQRLHSHPRGVIPQRGSEDFKERARLFAERAREAGATVEEITTLKRLPSALLTLLQQERETHLRLSPDPLWKSIAWEHYPSLLFSTGEGRNEDRVSVTSCFCAIAETGTVMILNDAHTPVALCFLAEVHIVVILIEYVVNGYEDAWDRLREKNVNPSSVHFITGPSRTGDIEQKIMIGAHGPRRVHVVLVG
ncbi:MAG: hypothetical protein A3F41_06910 [Coxiella sp. RIFCSPHIGHO2_12_FULL_44_14]|nr:MAG: hypothetical protein A3F41_06910 [Coxiella sp. RIFCSPHIGHO2_12_FULL_44_14]